MIGVVGDDTTGSLDIGVMFHRARCSVQMFTAPPDPPWPAADVSIIDTDSRLDPAQAAGGKVRAATRLLQSAGCTRFYKKTCSAFRGNIGAEFDALLDATGEANLIVAGAYPLLGRTTVGGRHFVQGAPLEKTDFARDPIHPRTTSDLRAIIAEQSRRSAGVVPLAAVRRDTGALRTELETLARSHAYLIVDGETQDDLARLAAAARDFRVFGGSAGFASVWPDQLPLRPSGASRQPDLPRSEAGVLFIAGSLTPQTRAQTQCLRDTSITAIELDPLELGLDDTAGRCWVGQQSARAATLITQGRSVLVATTQDPARVRAAQQIARYAGLPIADYGRKISGWLAALCAHVLAHTWPAGLVVAGGDTSGSVTRRLGVTGCQLVRELEPGIPFCLALGLARPLPVVFKSGSFGRDDFLVRCDRQLRNPDPVTPC
jgi:uncharacterized protein YgbK (DUF1537 family)